MAFQDKHKPGQFVHTRSVRYLVTCSCSIMRDFAISAFRSDPDNSIRSDNAAKQGGVGWGPHRRISKPPLQRPARWVGTVVRYGTGSPQCRKRVAAPVPIAEKEDPREPRATTEGSWMAFRAFPGE